MPTSTCDFLKIYHLEDEMTFKNIRYSVYEKTLQESKPEIKYFI